MTFTTQIHRGWVIPSSFVRNQGSYECLHAKQQLQFNMTSADIDILKLLGWQCTTKQDVHIWEFEVLCPMPLRHMTTPATAIATVINISIAMIQAIV